MSVNSKEMRLRRVIARVARVEPEAFGAGDDLRIKLGLDSLSSLRVAAGVEREFGVTIPDEKLHELRTVLAILEYLKPQ